MERTTWAAPSFFEIRMDAEIGSYQEDFDPGRDEPAFVKSEGLSPTAGSPRAVRSD